MVFTQTEMYTKDTFADKAAEGKSLFQEFGAFVMETLLFIGIPTDHVAAALLLLRPTSKVSSDCSTDENMGTQSKRTQKRVMDNHARAKNSDYNKMQIRNSACEDKHKLRLCKKQHRDSKGSDIFQRALRFVIEAHSSSPQQFISRLLFYFADVLGEPLVKPSQLDLEKMVGVFVEEAHSTKSNRMNVMKINKPLSQSLTGVVLSYHERDDMKLSPNALKKIRCGMHFDIPMHPFYATVQLLPLPQQKRRREDHYIEPLRLKEGSSHKRIDNKTSNSKHGSLKVNVDSSEEVFDKQYLKDLESQDLVGRMVNNQSPVLDCLVPLTPCSFPPTPGSRTRVLGEYSKLTENVLYKVRDELRGEQEDNDHTRIATFNPDDCHSLILLSCGGHCAMLDHDKLKAQKRRKSRRLKNTRKTVNSMSDDNGVERVFRSIRAALSIPNNRTTYFEICPIWTPSQELQPGLMNSYDAMAQEEENKTPLRVCVGLSTEEMPLCGTAPGCAPETIGLDSSGTMLVSGRRAQTKGFTYGSVVGVCVQVQESQLRVGFFVDGELCSCNFGDIHPANVYDSNDSSCGGRASSFIIELFALNESQDPLPTEKNFIPNIATTAWSSDLSDSSNSYFPTVSLKSTHSRVFANYSAADMCHADADTIFWAPVVNFAGNDPIFALDGTRMLTTNSHRQQR